MFDDPQKELKKLEEQLLTLETKDEEFERFYREIYEEFGPATQEKPAAAPVKKKQSTYADAPRAVAPKKKKSIKGLVITVCLESVGIIALAMYWIMRLL